MSKPRHPGFIVYVDGDTKEESREPISAVPESLRFAETEDGEVPVVKVVSFLEGNRRIIREYGPNDQFLRSTVQIRSEE